MTFNNFTRQLEELGITISETLSSHFYKENNILFPMGLQAIDEPGWKGIRKEFDGLGYCCFTPEPPKIAGAEMEEPVAAEEAQGRLAFETGDMSEEEIESIFNSLPVDITFVDKDDKVRYFSQSPERIFVRTKSVIGRGVQQCHPQKSLHVVNQILEDFRKGKKDAAEFWINMNDRTVFIRYFPVRNGAGEYLGCLEVTQDITDIKKIEGEKRLM